MLHEADSLAPHTSSEARNRSFSEEGAKLISAELDRSVKVLPIIAVAAAVIAFVVGAINPKLTNYTANNNNSASADVAARRLGDSWALSNRKMQFHPDEAVAKITQPDGRI